MATNNMIPISNPGGNNQTSPGAITPMANPQTPITHAVGPTANPIAGHIGQAQGNPLVPVAVPQAGGVVGSGGPVATPVAGPIGSGGAGTSVQGAPILATATGTGNEVESGKQFTDIYGKGIGGDISNLLNSISGVNSQAMQQYAASLVPQEAKASADLHSSMGAMGVGANSSAMALGEANLKAQETAAIAGEQAHLTESEQALRANILMGSKQDAAAEVAQSGWDVFGQVVQGLGKDAGGIISAVGDAGLL